MGRIVDVYIYIYIYKIDTNKSDISNQLYTNLGLNTKIESCKRGVKSIKEVADYNFWILNFSQFF